MSDLVLGMIIGGVIGIAGSAVVALIQGRYSFKCTKEDNLTRERQQSIQIQHEKYSNFVARLIARRASYLEPLSGDLSNLYTSLDNYLQRIIEIVTPHYDGIESDRILVREANIQKFGLELGSTKTLLEAIYTERRKVLGEGTSHLADPKLLNEFNALTRSVFAFNWACNEMFGIFNDINTGQDFAYDLRPLMDSISNMQMDISNAQRRIDSLLAGADVGNE